MRHSRKKSKKHQKKELNYRINEKITVPEVKLIDEEGTFQGVVPTSEALARAREAGLSLIEISPKDNPPVAKIMDYGKLQYQKQKQAQKQKAKQKKVEVKGIKLSFRIGRNDLEMRIKQAEKFLEHGHKVKIELNLRGRERQHKERAKEMMDNFLNELRKEKELVEEQPVKYKGNGFSAIVFYKK